MFQGRFVVFFRRSIPYRFYGGAYYYGKGALYVSLGGKGLQGNSLEGHSYVVRGGLEGRFRFACHLPRYLVDDLGSVSLVGALQTTRASSC